eukprot:6765226-Pyramimonas_sp.AAC.1
MAKKYKRVCKKGFIKQLGKRGKPLMDPQSCVQKWLHMQGPERREKDHPDKLAMDACNAAVAASDSGT